MGVELGKTRIGLTSRALAQLDARAVVRLFATLDELRAGARNAGLESGLNRPDVAPGWPGAPVVRPMHARPGCFHLDFCLEWRVDAPPASADVREDVIRRALEEVGRNVVVEARRWGCPEVAIPLPPAGPDDDRDRRRLRALCDGLVSSLKQPGPDIRDVWIVIAPVEGARRQPFAEELLAAMGRRPTRPSLPAVSPVTPSPPRAAPAPVVPPPDATPHDFPAPITLSRDGTFVDARLGERFLARAHDDAITTRMPHPIAVTWHLVMRRVAPEARLQALLHAGEVALRTLGGLLLRLCASLSNRESDSPCAANRVRSDRAVNHPPEIRIGRGASAQRREHPVARVCVSARTIASMRRIVVRCGPGG